MLIERFQQYLATAENLATRDDIVPGKTLWHVYGYGRHDASPNEVRVFTHPVTYHIIMAHMETDPPLCECDYDSRWFMSYDTNQYSESGFCKVYHSLWDCGIGKNYNNNRLFTALESAEAYAQFIRGE